MVSAALELSSAKLPLKDYLSSLNPLVLSVLVEGDLVISQDCKQFLPRSVRRLSVQRLVGVLPNQRSLERISCLGS